MSEEQKTEKVETRRYIDYKDITSLQAHINPHARMNSRKRTNFKASEQREFARAIKRARFMALMPYVTY